MDSGKIVAQGTPADLKASIGADVVTVRPDGDAATRERTAALLRALPDAEGVREDAGAVVVYIRNGARAIPRVVLLLDEAGIALADVNHSRPTLDDVFLRTTGHHIEVNEPSPTQPAAPGGRR
jgi:ABC-2 type transport system ATP-binding protein